MNQLNHEHDEQPAEIEYVGAPTEFADAQEVPEWVANAAKIFFFLPAAFVTASTIPILVFGAMLLCCLLFGVVFATLF